MRTTTLTLAALTLLAAGCAKKGANAAADSTKMASADTSHTAAPADTGKAMAGMDSDQAMHGSGVPTGYTAMTDHADAKITDAKYTETGAHWEVETGPAHIVYSTKDTASGVYAVTTTIQQLQAPKHPEAYGLFIGGQNLDNRATQQYTYFLVRGTGEYLVKERNGPKTTTIVNWKASPDVPKQDASGKATYALKVHVAPDTVHFFVNDKLVAAVPKKGLSTNGVAGLRINHNLHVSVEPVTITK